MVNNLFNKGFVILDGAMGTILQSMGLKTGRYPELLNLESPEAVGEIHRKYAQCGSDVVYAKLSDEEKLSQELHEMAERAFCDEYILSNSDMIVAAGELDARAGNIIRSANDRGIPVVRI